MDDERISSVVRYYGNQFEMRFFFLCFCFESLILYRIIETIAMII